jgi:hypothetical protein
MLIALVALFVAAAAPTQRTCPGKMLQLGALNTPICIYQFFKIIRREDEERMKKEGERGKERERGNNEERKKSESEKTNQGLGR